MPAVDAASSGHARSHVQDGDKETNFSKPRSGAILQPGAVVSVVPCVSVEVGRPSRMSHVMP
eukprot:365956-Chlamydomonas_euryale.AAC.5